MKRRTMLGAAVAACVAPLKAIAAAEDETGIKARGGVDAEDRPTLVVEIPIGEPGEPAQDVTIDWIKFEQVKGSAWGQFGMRLRIEPTKET